jgi:hypothetical protein
VTIAAKNEDFWRLSSGRVDAQGSGKHNAKYRGYWPAEGQHAHPGGCLHLLLAAMQELPHGFPLVQCLQQVSRCWASSTQADAIGAGSRPGHGV